MSGKLKYRSGRSAIAPQFYCVAAGRLQDTPAPIQSAAPPRRRRMNGQVLHCKRSHKQGNLALATSELPRVLVGVVSVACVLSGGERPLADLGVNFFRP